MAWLKKVLTKPRFILVISVWNALASYIPLHFHWSAETVALILTVGNAIIVWLGTESEQGQVAED